MLWLELFRGNYKGESVVCIVVKSLSILIECILYFADCKESNVVGLVWVGKFTCAPKSIDIQFWETQNKIHKIDGWSHEKM